MRGFVRLRDQIGDGKQTALLLVDMNVRTIASGKNFTQRHLVARSRTVVQRPAPAERSQTLDHPVYRRDADSTGEKYRMLRILAQREIVARRHHSQLRPHAQFIMDVA